MKKNLGIVAIALVLFASCHKSVEAGDCINLPFKGTGVTIKSSMKGWELYSWPGNACGGWYFNLLGGTNKLNSYTSATADTNLLITSGITQLKTLLDQFPQHETIFWTGKSWLVQAWDGQSTGNLQLPPADLQQIIKDYCRQRALDLIILPLPVASVFYNRFFYP